MFNDFDFLKELEQIRKKRKMTVEELCDGVISPRSYYRHLEENDIKKKAMKFMTLEKLMGKLNVTIFDLIILSYVSKNSQDPGSLQFVYCIYRNRIDLIKDLAKKLEDYHSDNLLINKFIDMHIYKYRYLRKEISLSGYCKLLKKVLSDVYKVESINVYKKFIMIECFRINQNMVDEEMLYKYVLEHDFCMNPIYSFIMISMYLRTILSKKLLTFSQREAIFNKYQEMGQYYNVLKPLIELNLYHAYISRDKGEEIEEKIYLIKYINGIISITYGPNIEAEFEMIKDEFGYDYKELLKLERKEIFQANDSPFNVIKNRGGGINDEF